MIQSVRASLFSQPLFHLKLTSTIASTIELHIYIYTGLRTGRGWGSPSNYWKLQPQSIMASPNEEDSQSKLQRVETSYTEMEKNMREQIRILQEQRATAMMNEMVDLQKERDIALSRIKMLKKSVEG